ncbi:PREDICTED: probable phospholipid-transporting ATPase 4 [Camelina sativa]|uniref:Phospholipid-transporting ATPase n=1 Tax=Camelina sativa TaxID=90675 RepID=A0ABM0VXW6_CAMSA|nr:PREDICTED: probable phospholipid-transporting ATPase 4 [Camelina sativa]
MARGRRRSKLRLSHIYTFGCLRPSADEGQDPHPIQGPGFSRTVYCNQPHMHKKKPLRYRSNYVSTTRYNMITFFPKSLYEQFHRAANFYFLVAAILSVFPLSPFNKWSMIAPLVFVVGLSMLKEALEDWSRFMQDVKINARKAYVHKRDGEFRRRKWKKISVGDIVKVEKDGFFPADLLLLSSSYEDGICYVETMNLDGETNLKVKRSLEATLSLDDDESFKDFTGTIRCEDPNPSLYTFVGNLEYERQIFPLDPSQILLRDSKLRNTPYVYGVVVFTGHDTKVMQNSTKSPSKRSRIEKTMDYIIYTLLVLLILISCISSSGFAWETKFHMPKWWYLRPEEPENLTNPSNPVYAGVVHLITALLLYGYLIPISLYVSIEVVKVLQASFINKDLHMYDSESGVPAHARTSNLNEELGQVDTILSDKTGTLTCNQMDFLKCSIAGTSYGVRSSEVEVAAAQQMAVDLDDHGEVSSRTSTPRARAQEIELESSSNHRAEHNQRIPIKGFGFEDIRLMDGNWLREPHTNDILLAKTSIGSDRDELLERISDMIEKDLILIGATAVEDKLQKGVPQCIDKLAQAGLKLWVLTGDKMETAINIGYSCSLLRQGMKQICITVMNSEGGSQEAKAVKENILLQITKAVQMVKLEKDPHAAFALIIDGKTLTYALEDEMKYQFLALAVDCASVICCRVSPKQKALVTRLVKEGTGKTTLAIGDGANDVGMIQEADIGVGISGVEGMQAVMASDFSIAQFRFLERLLVVHGHWCYKRIAQMICYFFYKNIAFGLTLFYFEAFTGFSGQSVYNDYYLLLFNVVLTSLPVIALGVFEQDVSSEICLQFPALYQQGKKNLFFDWYRIFGWMGNGVYSSLVIFFLNIGVIYEQAFRDGGQTADMDAVGTTMFTCIVWAVNVQIALTMSHFTWIQHVLIWGSIGLWYLFVALYGMMPPSLSGNIYRILVEILAPAPIYWVTTFLVTVTTVLPYFAHISFQRFLYPLDHHIIQEIKYYKRDVEDRRMWTRERSKAREKTKIGFTARVDAKIRHLRSKLNKKQSNMSHFSAQDTMSPRSV